MRLTIRLFASAAAAMGARQIEVELPERATAGQCREILAARGGDLFRRCTVAVDLVAVAPDHPLLPGGEVAVLPPVSGGQDLFTIGPAPLSAETLLAAVADSDCGGNVLFLGTVRGHTDEVETARLEYEAYVEMAAVVMAQIAGQATRLWPGVRLAMAHRTGALPPGAAAVGVAAAAAHRADAFAAARYCIERVKAELPVWKREEMPGGTGAWVAHG